MATIIRSNRGRKLLQTFLTKPFLIVYHTRFKEAMSSSALLWRVLQAFFLKVHSQAEVEGVQIWWLWEPKIIGPKAHVGIQPILDNLCRVGRDLLEHVLNFLMIYLPMEEFSSPKFPCSGKG